MKDFFKAMNILMAVCSQIPPESILFEEKNKQESSLEYVEMVCEAQNCTLKKSRFPK